MHFFVLSDLHITHKNQIPLWILNKLKNSELILINGDITSQEVLDEFKKISKCLIVKGNCDNFNLPLENVFELEGIKLGQIHGDIISPRGDWDQLYNIAHLLNVNVLFSGHTHNFCVYTYKNKIFINPGTATGTSSVFSDRDMGTIAEIDLTKKEIIVKILSEGEILLEKNIEFNNIL